METRLNNSRMLPAMSCVYYLAYESLMRNITACFRETKVKVEEAGVVDQEQVVEGDQVVMNEDWVGGLEELIGNGRGLYGRGEGMGR